MEEVRKKLKAFNEHYGHQLALAKPGATSAAKKKEVGVTNRTLCQPVFSAGDEPVDPLKVVTVKEAMSQVEFEKGKEQQGCFLVSMFAPRSRSSCLATGNQQLEVHILKESFQVWIVNGGDEAIQSDACELFGFNVGQFSDKSLGRAWWVLKFRANSSWRCCAGRRGQGHPIPAGVGYCPHGPRHSGERQDVAMFRRHLRARGAEDGDYRDQSPRPRCIAEN